MKQERYLMEQIGDLRELSVGFVDKTDNLAGGIFQLQILLYHCITFLFALIYLYTLSSSVDSSF